MSSHKNKVIRERLEKIYGKGCMFQKALIAERIEAIGGIKTYKEFIQEHKYTLKKIKKLESTMTLHHIKHRADGGPTSERNGAIVSALGQSYLHSLPKEHEEIVNGMLKEYKAGIDSGKYEKIDVEFVDDLDVGIEINMAELSADDKEIKVTKPKKFNRAEYKKDTREKIREWEEGR